MNQVEKVDTFLVGPPTIRPPVLSMRTMRCHTIIIVRLYCSDGTVGYGKGVPTGGLSYREESPDSIRLNVDLYHKSLLQLSCSDRPGQTMEAISKTVVGNQFAQAAGEAALLDAKGKRCNLPVSEILGCQQRERVPVAWTLASGEMHEQNKNHPHQGSNNV